ncbi:MAG: sigma 54-interacting transcriptional regulator [Spirochaetia bacterium]|nr:sigma 54-interacting transcriptional regulator [Spirochaetia bacterium]
MSLQPPRLCAWLGGTDIRASQHEPGVGAGPIAQALASEPYESLTLLSNYSQAETTAYVAWLQQRHSDLEISTHLVELSSPTEFAEIYEHAVKVLNGIKPHKRGHSTAAQTGSAAEGKPLYSAPALTFHLSPGTPAMAATWILIASSIYPARLIETSQEQGVRTVILPFDILAEYHPRSTTTSPVDEKLLALPDEMLPATPAFDEIIHHSKIMQRTVNRARRIALFDVPVLLLGESGTGKELFAKAIHNASGRADGPFISVNCGALPQGLVESELFGYVKGAFTGAASDKTGYIEEAHSGTLFLDEIGELPMHVQVLLLRVLQDQSFQRVGSTLRRHSDFRIISATNRDLARESADGSFRNDLFHRIAVGVLKLPPLHSRKRDIEALTDHFLGQLNSRFAGVEGWQDKQLSIDARRLIREYSWPGNVRELINTLTRACLWSPAVEINRSLLEESLVRPDPAPDSPAAVPHFLNRPLNQDFNIDNVVTELMQHYLPRALQQAGGNKRQAAKLLGLPNYQTLSNWLKNMVWNKPILGLYTIKRDR